MPSRLSAQGRRRHDSAPATAASPPTDAEPEGEERCSQAEGWQSAHASAHLVDGGSLEQSRPTLSLLAHIITGQRTLITNIEASPAYHRVRPARPALIGDGKPSLLAVAGRSGLGKADDVVLAQHVEVAVGVCDRPFSHAPVAPHHLAACELEAGQDGVVEAVQ